jgi:subtilisin family serine protease
LDEADFAEGIDALRACGASVLVDDLIYLSEPMFQDGLVAAAAQRATEAGIPYFSAAGNEAGFGVLQTFVDSHPAAEQADTPTGVDFNDFGGGSRFAGISVPAGCGIAVVLQWNEPFSGTLGPGATSDLDLYLYDQPSASGHILASSIDSQGCSSAGGGTAGDPIEIASFVNSGPQASTVYVAVDSFCGASDRTFRLATFPEGCGFPGAYGFDSVFHAPQIFGHPAAADVVAVGAVDYRELDTNGTLHGAPGTIDVETFTSLGGDLPFFFDATGAALPGGAQYRFKPELAAPDGTNTTFFGGDRPDDDDAWPNFYGTSAAAPHAAAVAALVRDANAALTPGDIRTILMAGARDIGASGIDPLAGAGAVDAMAAVAAARAHTPSLPTPTPSATVGSPTATATRTPPTPKVDPVSGDCNGDGAVTVADLIRGVDIALDQTPVSACPSLDGNGDGHVSIDELIRATGAALSA